VIRAN